MSRRRLVLPLVALASVAGCSSDGESTEDYVAPRATDAPGPDALAPDDAVIRFGEWGVVEYVSTDDESTILAIKVTRVDAGEPGDLGDVTVFGVDDIDELTPSHVAYVWVALRGEPTEGPTQNLAAYGPDDAVTLSLPASEQRCDPPAAIDYSVGLGYEPRGCATTASGGAPPVALVFQGPEGSSSRVFFEMPPAS